MPRLTETLADDIKNAQMLFDKGTEDRPAKIIMEHADIRAKIVIAEQLTDLCKILDEINKKLDAITVSSAGVINVKPTRKTPARQTVGKKVG